MIRTKPIFTLEDWKGREAILTVTDSIGSRGYLERVTIIEITPFALHCKTASGTVQVYVFGGGMLKAWEEVTERGLQELAIQEQALKQESAPAFVDTPPEEPTVVRKILTTPVPTKARNGIIEVEKS